MLLKDTSCANTPDPFIRRYCPFSADDCGLFWNHEELRNDTGTADTFDPDTSTKVAVVKADEVALWRR